MSAFRRSSLALALIVSAAAPASSQTPSATPPATLVVRGQLLSIGIGFVIFTTGTALRLDPQASVQRGLVTGSVVRATLDTHARIVTKVERDLGAAPAGQVDVVALDRSYAVVSSASAATSEQTTAPAALIVSVHITVSVPANTPTTEDVYIATDRSNFSPSEIRMQQLDARRFTITLSLPAQSRLRYQFTRGSNATVERDRSGDIATPHTLSVEPNLSVDDVVARWADLN